MTDTVPLNKFPITRRELLKGGASFATLVFIGCGESGRDANGEGANVKVGVDGGPDAKSADGEIIQAGDADADVVETPDLGPPEVSALLWQTMAAYARADGEGKIGTRINLYNPAEVTQRVVVQVFTMDGRLVAKKVLFEEMAVGSADHIELEELLVEQGIPLPFEGAIWVGATPKSGNQFMGLQGIVYDWYGPAHMASIHGMRDFGNSNHDTMWTDLILPKLVNTERYVSRIAIHNASGDGVSEALLATPEIIVRDADGTEIVRKTLDVMNPYCTVMLDIRDLIGDAAVDVGTLQIRDPEAGLVAMSFTYDTVNDGITSADHFFDRHFVVDSTGFTG